MSCTTESRDGDGSRSKELKRAEPRWHGILCHELRAELLEAGFKMFSDEIGSKCGSQVPALGSL